MKNRFNSANTMFTVTLFIGYSNNSVNNGKEISSIEVIGQSDKKTGHFQIRI